MSESLRILMLEDNPTDVELFQFELQEAGMVFAAKVVMSEKDYVRELQEFSPDLILSDYDLPTYNGAMAFAEARRRCPDTPFILVTGAVTEDRAIDILTQGAKDYVLKTRLEQRLVPSVQRALAEAEEHRARKQVEAELREAHITLEERVKLRTVELEAEMAARKKMEEALQKSETNYRELVENANSIIIRMDQNGTITFFNTYAQKFFGYTLDEILGKDVKILLPQIESNGKDMGDMMDNILRSPDDFEENINENVTKNGKHVWLLWKNRAMRDSAGNIIGNLAIANDITARKQAEQELRESEEKFRNLFMNMTEEVHFWKLVHDEQGQIKTWQVVDVNPPTVKAWDRVSREDTIGRTADEIYPGATEHFMPIIQKIMAEGIPYSYENYFPPPVDKYFRFTSIPLGEYFFTTGADITRSRKAEESLKRQAKELEDANKELESFSYSVSHDLRAPLRAIDGFSRKLEREYKDTMDEKFARTIDIIRNNAKMMGFMINDLLSFSKVQKTGMSITVIDMDELTKEVWNEIREAHNERELEFKITNVLPGYGDRALIRQVIFNLLSNAVKFTKDRKPGIIEISSYLESDKMVYCVKDNGAGFNMEYYDKLFDVFQRLHSHEEYEGTGIGLAIVQRIVERHGGRIWAESKVDEGATFYFAFPIQKKDGYSNGI